MSFISENGYNLPDETVEMIKNATFEDLEDIIAEASGIEFAENFEGTEEELEEELEHGVESFKFLEFGPNGVKFEITLDNGTEMVSNVPYFYFSED